MQDEIDYTHNKYKQKIAGMQDKIANTRSNYEQKIAGMQYKYEKEISDLQTENKLLKDDLSSLKNTLTELQQQIAALPK